MPTLINLYQAKTNLSRLVSRVEKGESFTLARNGHPVASLQPLNQELAGLTEKKSGFFKGRYTVPDDFDSAGQNEIIKMFEGNAS
jgi:antitoxin (DNA-binding transcriptional repressor) of toxin-antitoxin stability system